MKRELVFTKWGDTEGICLPMEDKELEKAIQEAFDFEIGYVPEHFGCAFLLIDDNEDCRKDDWSVLIKWTKIDDIYNFEVVKKNVNFEEVINIAVDIIKERYEELEKIYGKDENIS